MYCKHCGNQIDDDSLFCNKCGGEQKTVAPQPKKVKETPTEEKPKTIDKSQITPRSCPECGSTEHRMTRTNTAEKVNQVRICANCGNKYRTVMDVQGDIDHCKGTLIGIGVCAVILIAVLCFLYSALSVGETLEYWDWVDSDRKMSVYYFFIIAVIGAIPILSGVIKRAKELDGFSVEKERIEAEYSALCAKYGIPDMSGVVTEEVEYSDLCAGEADCLICAECEELNPITAKTCLNCGCELYNPNSD